MAAYFLDSSALVKRYHRERGTAWMKALCEPRVHPTLHISQLAQVEVIAALRRVGRTEQLHPSFVDTMVNMFERHLALSSSPRSTPTYQIAPLAPAVMQLAMALCSRYWDMRPFPLRSLDAIQLACAIAVAINLAEELIFVTADVRLAAIAPLEGFRVINPAYPTTTP